MFASPIGNGLEAISIGEDFDPEIGLAEPAKYRTAALRPRGPPEPSEGDIMTIHFQDNQPSARFGTAPTSALPTCDDPESVAPGEKANLLIVDDTAANLTAFASILEELGQNVVTARCGRDALQSLLRQDFAVILLDVNMPEMDGFETATLIRQRQSSERTPIIFVSAISTTETHAYQGYSLGAVDYIFTPVVPEVLRSKVAVFVELYLKNQAIKRQAARLRQLDQQEHERRLNEATESNAELEAFAYTVSHDLRAPLRAMQGFAQALLEDCVERLSPTGQDYAQRIISAATRLDSLIQDLLLYSRISHATLRLERVDMRRVIADAIAQLDVSSQQAPECIIRQEPFHPVVAHHSTLVQMVGNLLSNALKFVAPGVRPRVRIRMEPRLNLARLWIEDIGIGIAPEFHARVFRIFERLHGVEAYPGTGVGLAIVRKGAERMGGSVGLESQPKKGSRFWIELPLAN
jgi:signal transduction histidine kinase